MHWGDSAEMGAKKREGGRGKHGIMSRADCAVPVDYSNEHDDGVCQRFDGSCCHWTTSFELVSFLADSNVEGNT